MASSRSGPIHLSNLKKAFGALGGNAGMTMAELLVGIAILSIMGWIAIPKVNSSTFNLSKATDELAADLRLARGNANGRGAHYRVTISTNSYTVERLKDPDGDGVWAKDSNFPTRTVQLPSGMGVSANPGTIEFDTRGLVYPLPSVVITIQINDTKTGKSKQLQVWGSGQVHEV